MSADARAAVFAAIDAALGSNAAHADMPPLATPARAPIADRHALARRFRAELASLGGETRFVADEEAARAAIEAFARERGIEKASERDDWSGYAVLRASALFADTGSALVVVSDPGTRLAP
ncbi:MAG TPA: hypothetical protein VEJ20_09235, partial [Candidatus Eremiobacteraceae bacterium]|nr:hypothetical protein [Candidatus Eremiobacteraceae bacterium]